MLNLIYNSSVEESNKKDKSIYDRDCKNYEYLVY